MKRLSASLFVFSILGSTASLLMGESGEWKRFEHAEFVVHYPDSWVVKTGLPGTIIAFVSPKSDPSDPFRERVTVGIDTLKGGMKFEEYSSRTHEMLLTRLRRARKLAERTLEVSGASATELELSHLSHGPERIMRVVLIKDDDQVLNLMMSGQSPEYESMRHVFDGILNSFASSSPSVQSSDP